MRKAISFLFLWFILSGCDFITNNNTKIIENQSIDSVIANPSNIQYNFDFNAYNVFEGIVKKNWTLSHLLLPHGLSQHQINIAHKKAMDSLIDLRYIVPQKKYFVLSDKNDTTNKARYVIYKKNKVDYFIFDFSDTICVEKKSKKIDLIERIITGEIIEGSNLTFAINQELNNMGLTYELSEEIAAVFAWSIDFFKLHPGDSFKVLVDEKRVDGEIVGFDKIKAVWFNHQNNPYYSFRYFSDTLKKNISYFDELGKQMKRPFLMAPVKYSRISSGYSTRRFHPVQKRWKSHKGTDYAAPRGTPIYSTADGYIVAATRSRGNGNYVKVKHNDTYSTQYLHMSKIAKNMKKGVHVKQGQVIGYVGSTGLATGPHVCYRFWKNGKQINHRREKFPNNLPMNKKMKPEFLEFIKPFKSKLDSSNVRPYIVILKQQDSIQ